MTVTVHTVIRDIHVVAYVVGDECRAEPDVGIMSGHFEASHVECVEVDGDEACGLFPLSAAEEDAILDEACEQWEPEEWDGE